MQRKIIRLHKPDVDQLTKVEVAPDDVVRGGPNSLLSLQYINRKNKCMGGVWGSDEGCLRVSYDGDELLYIYEGQVLLTDEEGHSEMLNPGDAVIVPDGFKGTWETIKPVRKFWLKSGPGVFVPD